MKIRPRRPPAPRPTRSLINTFRHSAARRPFKESAIGWRREAPMSWARRLPLTSTPGLPICVHPSCMPGGDSITAYDGKGGWLAFPGRPTRDMTPSESASARLDADLHFATDLKQIFTDLRPAAPAKIGDRDTYVLVAMSKGQPPVKLYFDQQSGLLVRMLRFSDSPLGLNPVEIDYADYRDVEGVKTPFRWTLTRTSGAFTIEIDSVQQNVSIDDRKFARPTS